MDRSLEINIRRLGLVPYGKALRLQEATRDRVLAGGSDELLLLEHPPVVTIGRRGGEFDAEALDVLGTEVVRTDRGGLATWHGPGQIVGYPIVDLRRRRMGVSDLVQKLGKTMRETCQAFGLAGAEYDCKRPGVYIEGRKLGAIGLHIHHGVTTHGFALNVNCDLRAFASIVACGQQGMVTTSLAHELNRRILVDEVQDAVEHFIDF